MVMQSFDDNCFDSSSMSGSGTSVFMFIEEEEDVGKSPGAMSLMISAGGWPCVCTSYMSSINLSINSYGVEYEGKAAPGEVHRVRFIFMQDALEASIHVEVVLIFFRGQTRPVTLEPGRKFLADH